jgi:hypothetical protein
MQDCTLTLQVTVVCLAEPGCFRSLHSFVQGAPGGAGRLEVRTLVLQHTGPATATSRRRRVHQPRPCKAAAEDM